jgi:hypothetical protein
MKAAPTGRAKELYPRFAGVLAVLEAQYPELEQPYTAADEWLFPCPVHPEDDIEQLFVYPEPGGRAVLECDHGCRAIDVAILGKLPLKDICEPKQERERPARFRLLSDLELEQLPPIEFLVEGVLPRAGLGTLYGAPGAGKSFLALDMACSVASGAAWLGHATHQGSVVYVAAEGSAGLRQRLAAWKQHQGIAGGRLPVYFLTEPANLLTTVDVAALRESIDYLDDPPALIIIDTLHRSMPGGDENSAKDLGLVIEHSDRLRRATGASVLLVHHTALNSDRERGSSSLRGAMDALLFAKVDEGGRILKCEKAKDWAPFPDMPFRLEIVGESCVAIPAVSGESISVEALSPAMRKALTILSRDFATRGATSTEWLAASELVASTYYRVRSDCVRYGYVTEPVQQRGGRYRITDSGINAVAPTSHEALTILPDSQPPLLSLLSHPFRGESDESKARAEGQQR